MVDKINGNNNPFIQQQAIKQNRTNTAADSIFDVMDKDHNQTVDTGEAKAFGFTTLGDKPLTREQFSQKYSIFQEKTNTLNGILEGFGDIFYSGAEKGLVHDVELSNAQQKELLSRIEMTEAYSSTLDDEKESEWIKSKSAIMGLSCFSEDDTKEIPENYKFPENFDAEKIKEYKAKNKRGGLWDYDHLQYKEFINNDLIVIKDKLKSGNLDKISNEDLVRLLEFAKVNDLESDGKIGSFHQGSGVGDCWFLSMLNNYSSTPDGEKNIEERIKNNNDGTYSVILQNPFEQTKKEEYKISKTELSNWGTFSYEDAFKSKRFSSGDIDVRIMEIGMNKMLEKYLPPAFFDEREKRSEDELPIEGSGIHKQFLVHRALGYTDKVRQIGFRDENSIQECDYNFSQGNDGRLEIEWKPNIQHNCTTLLEIIKNFGFKDNELTADIDDGYTGGRNERENHYLIGHHSYNIMKTGNNEIVVNNPHASVFPHVISNDTFTNNGLFDGIMIYPQQHRIPLSECDD